MTLGSYPEWSAAGESGMKKNKMDTQEYQFIKETVKKQPKENGSLLRRLLMIAGCTDQRNPVQSVKRTGG